MSKRVVYSPYSVECLKNILNYIKEDSIERAHSFIEKILNTIDNLGNYPELGKEIEDNKRKILINKNYVVIYEINGEIINILSVTNVKMKE